MTLPTSDKLKTLVKVETAAEDTLLADLMTDATAIVQSYLQRPILAVRRTFVDRAITARAYQAVTRLLIPVTPVALADPTASPAIAAPVITDKDGATVDATTYTIDTAEGFVIGNPGVTFEAGPYTIVATVGLSVHPDYATEIEPVLGRAILDVATDLYLHRTPGTVRETAGGGVSVEFTKDALPARTAALLQRYRMLRWA